METRRDVFQAIADPTRRAILTLVALHAMTPNAIAERFDSKRQTVSKHIQILSECKLLKQKQVGREIFYHLNLKKMTEINEWLNPFMQLWEKRFDSLEKYLEKIQKTKK
ncbi:MAG: winged helix-turn-helix transcriptional regulator [Bacteroidia bacterium]|nr:winged helix-turn-helix transcriptional regulator [Bacteroidia bacterium]